MSYVSNTIRNATYLLATQKNRLLNELDGTVIFDDPKELVDKVTKTIDEILRRVLGGLSIDDLNAQERNEVDRIIKETTQDIIEEEPEEEET